MKQSVLAMYFIAFCLLAGITSGCNKDDDTVNDSIRSEKSDLGTEVSGDEEAESAKDTVSVQEPRDTPAPNEVWYTSVDGAAIDFPVIDSLPLVSNVYADGKGVLTYDVDTLFSFLLPQVSAHTAMDTATHELYVVKSDMQERLASIILPEAVTDVGGFGYCRELTAVELPSGLERIRREAFYLCDKLKDVEIPDDRLIYIGASAFSSTRIEKLVLNAPIIETQAFEFCRQLQTVEFGDKVTSVPMGAFSSCAALHEVKMGNNVQVINSDAFRSCRNLKEVCFPDGLEFLGASAFVSTSISSVVIPASLLSMPNDGMSPFYGCPLTSIEVATGNPVYDSRNNCNAIIETSSNTLLQASASTVIPEDVRTIASGAFFSINLTALHIPASVTRIASNAFVGAVLKSITVASDNPVYDSRNDCNALVETASNTLLKASDQTVIPDDVEVIGYKAFSHVAFQDGQLSLNHVKTIEKQAFERNKTLESISFDQVQTIAKQAFNGCDNLKEITFSDSVQFIGWGAFMGCGTEAKKAGSIIPPLHIPASVQQIESGAFSATPLTDEVYVYWDFQQNPPQLAERCFTVSGSNTLHVKKGQAQYLSSYACFNVFTNIVEDL